VHAKHVVHRNVDPRGIVVSRDGRVVLLDFGMAKEDKPAAAVRFEPNDEAHGQRYTAPERIMGEPATPMSDVFSLGVVLYEMLCGQGPWDEGKPPRSKSPKESAARSKPVHK
jgi:serine/threonine-protein kinase